MPNLNNQPSKSASTSETKPTTPTANPTSNGHVTNGTRPPQQSETSIESYRTNGASAGELPPPETLLLDSETVAERVKRERPRSLRMQYRFLRALVFAAWLFVRVIFWQIYMYRWFPRWVERTNDSRLHTYAREFRRFAIGMGGVMIKLGQFASTRVDVLPEEVIQELEGLQDEVPSVPYEAIKKVIESELGPINKRYEWIDPDSVSSASLGQVYRAKLLDGDRVVIKVQRPGIRGIVYTDLAALMIVARVAMRFRFINKRADVNALAEEFGRVLLEEVSYRKEVENAQRFARMFKDDMGVYIPSVYTEHCTDRVITMEDVTTIKINDFAALQAAGISRKTVAQRLMNTYMGQIFEERFFHADPHPGNLFVYPLPVKDEHKYVEKGGGRPFYLIFVDFGMTGSLSPDIRQGIIDTMAAVIARDAKKLVAAYKKLGFLLPRADEKRIEAAVKIVFDQVWGLSMNEMASMDFEAISDIGREFNDLLYDMPFQVPQDFIYLGRSVTILTGICTALDPDYNPWNEIQRNMQPLVTGQNGVLREVTQNSDGGPLNDPLMNIISKGSQEVIGAIEQTFIPQNSRARAVLDHIGSGELEVVARRTIQHRRQLDRIETQGRRQTRAIVFGSFLITSTLLYTNGDANLALAGYTLSGITFLSMMFTQS